MTIPDKLTECKEAKPSRLEQARLDDFALPATQYALSGDVSIAYQVMGNGPIDLVMVPGLVS
ncbi:MULTISPECIES: hypothetical protein [unclassified Bradyrhizobium]